MSLQHWVKAIPSHWQGPTLESKPSVLMEGGGGGQETASKKLLVRICCSCCLFINSAQIPELLATKYSVTQHARQYIWGLRTVCAHSMAQAEATKLAADVIGAQFIFEGEHHGHTRQLVAHFIRNHTEL